MAANEQNWHEVITLSKLRDVHILKYVDHFKQNDGFLLVSEFAQGGDLRDHINECVRRHVFFTEYTIQIIAAQMLLQI